MKMIFNNIKSFDYIVEFHDIHLYYDDLDDTEIEYLFCINKKLSGVNKKYLLPINNNHFKQFIRDCIEFEFEIKSKFDFETEVIQLIEKYSNINKQIINYLNIKLGSLILSNLKYKNFAYLKKIEKYFIPEYANITDTNCSKNNNLQIQYLIIMINNLINVSTNPTINLNYQIDKNLLFQNIKTDQYDHLDFIFDYFTN